MKYINAALKEKLHGTLGVSCVIEGEEGHNRIKQEDGTFKDQNTKLVTGEIVPQNDLITINFEACEEGEITMNSDQLRWFAEELLSWATIVEETL